MNPASTSLTLYRHTLFSFYGMESGTFMVMPYAPFGSDKPLLSRIAELLEQPEPAGETEMAALAEIYLVYCADFPGITQRLHLSPGIYNVPDVTQGWRAADNDHAPDDEAASQRYVRDFRAALQNNFATFRRDVDITPAHLAMVQTPHLVYRLEYNSHALAGTIDFHDRSLISDQAIQSLVKRHHEDVAHPEWFYQQATVCGDGKRPYGNRTYYYWDLEDAGIAGSSANGEIDPDNQRRLFSSETRQRIDQLQCEGYLALQALALYGEVR